MRHPYPMSSQNRPSASQPPNRNNPHQRPRFVRPPPKPTAYNLPAALLSLPARHQISNSSVHQLSLISSGASPREILEKTCMAIDITPAHRLDFTQTRFFAAVNSSPSLRWRLPVGAKPSDPWHKCFLTYQIYLGPSDAMPKALSAGGRQTLSRDKKIIFESLAVALRCYADICGARRDGTGLANTLWLLRSLYSGVWDEPGMELQQVRGFGPKRCEVLTKAGILSMRQLAELDSSKIEVLFKRQPPYGETTRRMLVQFPRLYIEVQQKGWKRQTGIQSPPEAVLQTYICMKNSETPRWEGKVHRMVFMVTLAETGRLVYFWRGSVKSIEERGIAKDGDESKKALPIWFTVSAPPESKLELGLSCEEVAGSLEKCTHTLK